MPSFLKVTQKAKDPFERQILKAQAGETADLVPGCVLEEEPQSVAVAADRGQA